MTTAAVDTIADVRAEFDRLKAYYEEHQPGTTWKNVCYFTCVYLSEGSDATVVVGAFSDEDAEDLAHCWLELEDGTWIDPTASQFGLCTIDEILVMEPDDYRRDFYCPASFTDQQDIIEYWVESLEALEEIYGWRLA